jgi:S-adenosyl methyltransferase
MGTQENGHPASPALEDAAWVSEEGIDTSVAHPARRYDYWLGGKDNFAADRASGEAVMRLFPAMRTAVVENRRFLGRAVDYLAGEAGISQFLDIGTGIPSADNTHEVAQRLNPSARIVYVDNDPIVLAHARALLASEPQGVTAYIDADVRHPDSILSSPVLAATLDLGKPVALMLVALMHFITDEDRPYDLVRTLVDALPAGSYLAMSHATFDYLPPDQLEEAHELGSATRAGWQARTRAEFARFFDGLELVPPGVVSVAQWRADGEPEPRPTDEDVSMYGAVARIPG